MAHSPTSRTPDGQPVEFDVVPERGSVVAAAERHPDTGELLPVYVTYPDGHDAPPIAYRHRLPGEPLLVGGAYSVAEMCRRLAARQAVRVRRVIVLDAAADRQPVPSSRQPAPPMPDGGEAARLAPEPRPRRPRRAMPPARDAREGLRRLLNVRTTLAERLTGEDPSELRHGAVADATGGRTRSSMDRSLSADEMGHAVSYVEDYLHSLGHQAEMDAQDAEYAARRGRQAA